MEACACDTEGMVSALHTYEFGPTDAPTVLALHGLTGHGKRWEHLAPLVPQVRIVAPDLLGHGHSPWTPPWSIEDHASAVAAAVDAHVPTDRRPLVVVAHSFGSAVALRLAHDRPDLVKGLVLLDPAQGLAPEFAMEMAQNSVTYWGYPDAAAAQAAKRAEGWAAVPAEILDGEIVDHLIATGDGVSWRVCAPAAATAWSELARPALLPPPHVPTRIVVAERVQPPFVTADFLARCAAERGDSVRVTRVDTEHMVPFLAPETVATLIQEVL